MTFIDVVFLVTSLVCVAAGLLAVTRRSPLYSALWLLVTLIGVAVIFYLFSAPFLAMMQVVVYAGAILVLFLFVIMLLNLRPEDMKPEAPAAERAASAVVAILLLAVLAYGILSASGGPGGLPLAVPIVHDYGSIEGVGRSLFSRYVVQFEALSVLIVAAVVGAVLLAKRKL
jgi:NADH-quinone oxidoreductase subunit J